MTDLQTANNSHSSFSDLAKDLWSYLTGLDAAINYEFIDMAIEVPKETGPDSERATWKLNGTLRITTMENADKPTS
jgi:hypothetical protein